MSWEILILLLAWGTGASHHAQPIVPENRGFHPKISVGDPQFNLNELLMLHCIIYTVF